MFSGQAPTQIPIPGRLFTADDSLNRESGLIVTSLPVSRPASSSSCAAPQTGQTSLALKFTSTETGIEFKKISKTAKAIDKKLYDGFIEALVRRRVHEEEKVPDARAQVREAMVSEITLKSMSCPLPTTLTVKFPFPSS